MDVYKQFTFLSDDDCKQRLTQVVKEVREGMRYEMVREDKVRVTETAREKKKKAEGTKRRKGINVKENNTGTKQMVKERKYIQRKREDEEETKK
jgi:hypothetical protein